MLPKNSSQSDQKVEMREGRKLTTGDERKKRMDALEKYVESNYGSNDAGGPQKLVLAKSRNKMEES